MYYGAKIHTKNNIRKFANTFLSFLKRDYIVQYTFVRFSNKIKI